MSTYERIHNILSEDYNALRPHAQCFGAAWYVSFETQEYGSIELTLSALDIPDCDSELAQMIDDGVQDFLDDLI